MSWSEEQVIALSPDIASAKSGKDLAKIEKWVSVYKNENALWGECKGSGSKPYQTQIDLNNIAFKCSCPSRKFPCKHGIGLLLLFAKTPTSFIDSESPDWVTEWLAKRAQREEKKAEKQDKPVDEVAQAKRQQSRHQKVSDGIDELKLWIKDLIRNGILSAPEKPLTYWENMAKRLIDAQSPGLSRMITNLGNTNFYTENWQGSFLDQLLKIFLIIEGYHNLSALDPALQEDIKSSIGFTQNQEELKEQKGITDTWFVLGKQVVEEDTYTTEKYWMLGQQSNKYALILQFVFNGQGRSISLIPGSSIEAELVYYPSVAPLRAIIKSSTGSNQTISLNSHNTWKDVLDEEVRIYSLLPFSGERPLVISNVTPVLSDNQWWLMDTAKDINLISPEFKSIYKLLAISGGNPVTIAAVGYHNTYEPIACWHKEQFYIL